MSAAILLAGLRRRGFDIAHNPARDVLVVEPASKLTESDRRALEALAQDLIALVREPVCEPTFFPPDWAESDAWRWVRMVGHTDLFADPPPPLRRTRDDEREQQEMF